MGWRETDLGGDGRLLHAQRMADRAFRVRFRAGGGGRDARKLGAGRFVETGFIWYIALTGTRSNIYHEESFRALLKGLGRRSINFFMYGNGGHDPAPNLIDLPAATGSKYQVSSSLRLAADVPLDARTPSLPLPPPVAAPSLASVAVTVTLPPHHHLRAASLSFCPSPCRSTPRRHRLPSPLLPRPCTTSRAVTIPAH